jgi:cystine transport system permease protein
VLALSLNAGAYLSESLRGAIVSISQGQWRASFSLGLGYWQTLATWCCRRRCGWRCRR